MADTRRTLAALQGLLADNSSGQISPQDVRDMLLSLAAPYGGVDMSGNTTPTTIGSAGTFVKANWNSLAAVTHLRQFTMDSSGRLTFSGPEPTHCHVVCQASAYVNVAASKDLSFAIYKNGVTKLPGQLTFTSQGTGDITPIAVHTDVMLDATDYLELWATNEDDTNGIILHDAYLFAMGMLV